MRMTHDREKAVIKASIDDALSGADALPTLRYRVLRQVRGEEKVKKKLSVGLILIIALLLAAVTGLAVTLCHEYFEQVGQLQVKSGYYDDWTLDEKLQMLSLMEKYGVLTVENEDAVRTARDTSLPEADREKALDAMMAEKYGIYGRTDTIGLESILEKEKGSVLFWPVEEKAWYTRFQSELGLLSSEEERLYTVPGKGEMSQDAAEKIAREYLRSEETSWGDWADSAEAVNFALVHASGETANTWEITFYQADADEEVLIALPSCEGTNAAQAHRQENYLYDSQVLTPWREKYQHLKEDDLKSDMVKKYEALSDQYGPANTWSLEVLHEYLPDTYALPEETDLTPEKAAEAALDALCKAYPDDVSAIHSLRAHVQLLTETMGNRGYMTELLDEKGNCVYYAILKSDTGEILKTATYKNIN